MKRPQWRRPRFRHPRRVGLTIAALVVVLCLDLATTVLAQNRVQTAVSRSLPGARVHARVGGWPVSAHLGFDQLGSVTMDAEGVSLPTRGREIDVESLHAKAEGVHGVRSGRRFRLDHVEGKVRLTWAELSRQTGANLSLTDDGLVRVQGTVPVLGEDLRGSLQGRLRLDPASQEIQLDAPIGSLDEVQVPPDIITGLVTRLSSRFALPTVPGLTWTAVRSDASGVVLTFTGDQLVFAT